MIENLKKLDEEFFLKNTLNVAMGLLGKIIVKKDGEKILYARIKEVEGYIGYMDKACHCYPDKMTERTKVMYEKGGTSYVYLIYGMYSCFNIVTEKKGLGCAVLIRGGEPLKESQDDISLNRFNKSYNQLNSYEKKNLLNGPGKLCKGLNITREDNNKPLFSYDFFIASDDSAINNFYIDKRINIDYAKEAKDFYWRYFY